MPDTEEDEYEISSQQGEFILEKQFESHQNTQDSLFKLIRFIGLGITGIVGVISIINSIDVRLNSFSDNLSDNITRYNQVLPDLIANLIIALTLIISFFIFSFLLVSTFLDSIRVVQRIIDGLESPTLEPIEARHKICESSDEAKNIEKWINNNRKKISTSSTALDEAYEFVLSIFFQILGLSFIVFVIYSADPRILGIFISLLFILYWAYKFRQRGELLGINQDFDSKRKKYKVYATTGFGVTILYLNLFLYEILSFLAN
jgi:hypothetical protein